ncbi:trypsin-like peptidase domain-containing protein [Streptomyces sp. NPDC004296]|uniref:nSTAND1 domain-containing NTPase n=1 Tax=Streptomyces sp. NPDC004296 TaxID=3364697 RepID=UPI0036A06AEC
MESGTRGLGDEAVVRVVDGAGRPAGAGFLTADNAVVTCAHVVAAALGLPETTAERPDEPLWLDFPLARPGQLYEARVAAWVPTRDDESGDMAVLTLRTEPPAGAALAQLVEYGGEPGLPVRTFGFPRGNDSGVWSAGVLRGRQATGWVQYDADPASQYEVQRGFSGAPVWDSEHGGVVGMVVTADARPGRRTAYLIPTAILCATWPPLRQAVSERSPFRPLRQFQEADAELFHGRGEPAGRIVARLDADSGTGTGVGTSSGITLVGVSGCGKSSLLHAGVLPRLRHDGALAIVAFQPGPTPLQSLTRALVPLLDPELPAPARPAAEARLTRLLRQREMPEVVRQLLDRQGRRRLLLIADQFEQALLHTDDDLDAFAAALGHCREPESPLQVVMALRADFLTTALNHAGLAPLLDDGRLFTLGPMSRDEVRAAIEQPIARAGVRYERGLVDRLLNASGHDASRLPLLEFTLGKLWDLRKHGTIGHAQYDSLGELGEALANHAEDIWGRLREEERRTARTLLVQLATPGGGDRTPTRRTVARTDLDGEQWRLAQRLMTTRLLVPGEERRGRDGTVVESVELAHETLLTQWTLLRDLIREAEGFRRWQEDLRQHIARWEKEDRARSRLIRGSDLRDAKSWQSRRGGELTSGEREFVAASRASARRRRVTAAAVAAALVLVPSGGIWAWRSASEAATRSDNTATAADALVQQAHDAAAEQTQGAPYTALLLAMRAYRTHATPKSEALLGEEYATYGSADAIVPDYDADTPLHLTVAGPSAGGSGVPTISADGRTALAANAEGKLMAWRLGGRTPVGSDTGQHQEITAVPPDGSLIAMTHDVGHSAGLADKGGSPVLLYDTRSHAVRKLQPPAQGDLLALPDWLRKSLPSNIPPGMFPPGTTVPTQYRSLAFDPSGRRLAALTGSLGGRLIVWDVASGRIQKVIQGLEDAAVSYFSFSADGSSLITIGSHVAATLTTHADITVESWPLDQPSPRPRRLLTLSTKKGAPAIGLSPDGSALAIATPYTGERDIHTTVTVYALPSGKQLRQEQLPGTYLLTGVALTHGGTLDVPYFASRDANPLYEAALQLASPWQGLALLGDSETASGPAGSVVLVDRGLTAFVPLNGVHDPRSRIPTGAPKPSGGPAQWIRRLCQTVADGNLPPAAQHKLPPGAYLGPLCP